MSVTRPHLVEGEENLVQIDRLVQSHTMHGSESLRKLLKYLAEHAVHHPGVPLKEYQIATEVFGRASDFDPQSDSAIRVQAGRLRQKLTEYYAVEGAEDPIVVELPKGTYLLSFHPRSLTSPAPAVTHSNSGLIPQVLPLPVSARRRANKPAIVLGALFAAAVVVILVLVLERRSSTTPTLQEAASPQLRTFWAPFISGDETWLIFSNGAFVGRPETGMRYFDAERDAAALILNHYTGVGEVLAVHDLDTLFASLGKHLRVKRGSLFTLDDAENNNLIFIGSPAENLTLRDLPNTRHFVFQRSTSGGRKGDLTIANLHAQAGEPAAFYATPGNLPLVEDYAIVGLVPGLNPAHRIMILAGTTTLGTQAAAEFVCRRSSVERLLLRLSVSQGGAPDPFEAVLHVKVTRGVPVETELVAIRKETP